MANASKDILILSNTTIIALALGFFLSEELTLVHFVICFAMGFVGGIILIYADTREEIIQEVKREKSYQKLYETDALSNTLLVDDSQTFEGYSGTLFITTTNESDYLGIIRLQDQFNILNFEIQKGSVYLIRYPIETNRKWHTIPHNKQKIYLKQIYQHFEDFNSALHALIPGVKTRQLTFKELDEYCGIKTQPRVKIDFIPDIPDQEELLESKEASLDGKDLEDNGQLENEFLSNPLIKTDKS